LEEQLKSLADTRAQKIEMILSFFFRWKIEEKTAELGFRKTTEASVAEKGRERKMRKKKRDEESQDRNGIA
jgi:hypothetical protein